MDSLDVQEESQRKHSKGESCSELRDNNPGHARSLQDTEITCHNLDILADNNPVKGVLTQMKIVCKGCVIVHNLFTIGDDTPTRYCVV